MKRSVIVVLPEACEGLAEAKAAAALQGVQVQTSALLEDGNALFLSPELQDYMEERLGGDFL
jgi:hypothetical protein